MNNIEQMTALDLVQTLTNNVCIANNVDPNKLNKCLDLACELNGLSDKMGITKEMKNFENDKSDSNLGLLNQYNLKHAYYDNADPDNLFECLENAVFKFSTFDRRTKKDFMIDALCEIFGIRYRGELGKTEIKWDDLPEDYTYFTYEYPDGRQCGPDDWEDYTFSVAYPKSMTKEELKCIADKIEQLKPSCFIEVTMHKAL